MNRVFPLRTRRIPPRVIGFGIDTASLPKGQHLYSLFGSWKRFVTTAETRPSDSFDIPLDFLGQSRSQQRTDQTSAKTDKLQGLQQNQKTPIRSPQEQSLQSIARNSSRSHVEVQAMKRKAEEVLSSNRARRRRTAAVKNIKDEAYIRRHHKFPSYDDTPGLPPGTFDHPKPIIHNAFQGVATLRSTFKESHIICCTLQCKHPSMPDQQYFVGEGFSKKSAERVAYLHLIAVLHKCGLLDELGARREKIDKETLNAEADAKTDIYNYAARFDAVPVFNEQKVGRLWRGKSRELFEVVIELPEQGIKATGIGNDLRMAEITAGIQFKQEAEKFHAQHGESSIMVKDPTALNTTNVKKFFDFYKMQNKTVVIEIQSKQSNTPRSLGRALNIAHVSIDSKQVGKPVVMPTKKQAEELAMLTAAVELKKQDKDTYPKFLRALRAGNGEILKPIGTVEMPVNEDCVLIMNETLSGARRAGLQDEQVDIIPDEEAAATGNARSRRKLTPAMAEARAMKLQKSYDAYLSDPTLAELRKQREALPMNQYRAKVIEIIRNNTYSIIVGATGSGKTTQVPQILLETAILDGSIRDCNIICTQPRRIAATSVARRVAVERAEKIQDSVGYHVRFDAKLPQLGGSITYCTTGILLQQLRHSPDMVLDGTSHLVIDEVHERDILIDFLLIILKKTMSQRAILGKANPKVVLMSATMDTELFASYFKLDNNCNCPSLSVPGRTFPVTENHLEEILETMKNSYSQHELGSLRLDPATQDYLQVENTFRDANPSTTCNEKPGKHETLKEEISIDWKRERGLSAEGEVIVSNDRDDALVPFGLVAATIAHIAKSSKDGAILVFLPGLQEIMKVDEILKQGPIFGINFKDDTKFKLSMLHSSIPASQTEVFDPVAPGSRKIILATNIAETSVTIPDVQYVVDTGKLREKQYDQIRRISKLQCTWISKSSSKQRAGRAGRVQNGNYYALFSRERHQSLRAIGLPEMLRADLQEICLDIKAQAFKTPIREFLAEAIEPPASRAVDASVLNLQALEALTDDEKLTPLGRLLASLPVHPSLGKMIVLGAIFRCLDPMLLIGAAASERSLFVNPIDKRQDAENARFSFVEGSASDHVAIINVMREMRQRLARQGQPAAWDFGQRNFIHYGAFKAIDSTARQIEDILVEAGLIPFTPPNRRLSGQLGDPMLNENSHKIPVIKALALAGLHPNLAVNTGGRTFRTPGEKGTIVHPSSINAPRSHRKEEDKWHGYGTLLSYSTMARSNDGGTIFLRDTSESSPLMAALFGGRLRSGQGYNVLHMDDWLPFYVKCDDRRAVKTIIEFRKALDRVLTGAFQDLSVRNQEGEKRYLADDTTRAMFAKGLVDVLDRDGKFVEAKATRGWSLESNNYSREFSHQRRRAEQGDREETYQVRGAIKNLAR